MGLSPAVLPGLDEDLLGARLKSVLEERTLQWCELTADGHGTLEVDSDAKVALGVQPCLPGCGLFLRAFGGNDCLAFVCQYVQRSALGQLHQSTSSARVNLDCRRQGGCLPRRDGAGTKGVAKKRKIVELCGRLPVPPGSTDTLSALRGNPAIVRCRSIMFSYPGLRCALGEEQAGVAAQLLGAYNPLQHGLDGGRVVAARVEVGDEGLDTRQYLGERFGTLIEHTFDCRRRCNGCQGTSCGPRFEAILVTSPSCRPRSLRSLGWLPGSLAWVVRCSR